MRRPTRRTDGAFSDSDLDEFLLGEAIPCRSDRIQLAQWSADEELLYLSFPGDVLYAYPCNERQAVAFARAPSKGGALWDMWLARGETGQRV